MPSEPDPVETTPQGVAPLTFNGRVAWVTGAARGIGLRVSETLAQLGARVVGIDVQGSDALNAIATRAIELNVADVQAVRSAAEDTERAGLAPDVVVNNAGVTRDGVVWKLSEEAWDTVIDVNLKGAFAVMQAAIPLMRTHGRGGSIVNIASINGVRGKAGQSNYCASKAGLIGLTKAVAREVGRFNIRANAVAPGLVDTEMTRALPAEIRERALAETQLNRFVTLDDVARAVAFLASDWAEGITGQVVHVDAGQLI